jgi:hypothetical protein
LKANMSKKNEKNKKEDKIYRNLENYFLMGFFHIYSL